VCAKFLPQPIFHEVDYIGGLLILNTTQHLDSGNTNQFDEVQKLMVKYGRSRNFVSKFCKKFELVFFLQIFF
jgi:hypothetical protein